MSVTERLTVLLKKYSPAWTGDMESWDPDALDSLDYIELAFDIEDEFDITLPWDPDAMKVPSDVVRLVQDELARKGD